MSSGSRTRADRSVVAALLSCAVAEPALSADEARAHPVSGGWVRCSVGRNGGSAAMEVELWVMRRECADDGMHGDVTTLPPPLPCPAFPAAAPVQGWWIFRSSHFQSRFGI